jgi:protein-tyrosine phosphatase
MKRQNESEEIRWQPALALSPRAARFSGRAKVAADLLALRRAALEPARHRIGMDMTWVTDRIAVGGGIWTADNMAAVARAGVTHIIDMQVEFDDTQLAIPHGIDVLWNPTDDDFEPKPPELFERGVKFALAALDEAGTKLFIHCAAGVHRAPMMALALLGAMGWKPGEAAEMIGKRRPVADFADVYLESVVNFLESYRE